MGRLQAERGLGAMEAYISAARGRVRLSDRNRETM